MSYTFPHLGHDYTLENKVSEKSFLVLKAVSSRVLKTAFKTRKILRIFVKNFLPLGMSPIGLCQDFKQLTTLSPVSDTDTDSLRKSLNKFYIFLVFPLEKSILFGVSNRPYRGLLEYIREACTPRRHFMLSIDNPVMENKYVEGSC
ncbi:hypothetical protein LOAG_11514 [Loa loa]|uniref:Uncharacterized protein n=1 Tax=Loa loa TaxID=7209 RepID=A0A1S0TP35_LOALO|nr:hypothetical protein LOAG_11514 [Loa loa]EFO16991.1 hypothetical protein LOAG_11514 [Loa loa]